MGKDPYDPYKGFKPLQELRTPSYTYPPIHQHPTPSHQYPIPDLRKFSFWKVMREVVFYATALAAIGGWIWKTARNQVDASEMTEVRKKLEKYEDRLAAVETNTAVINAKLDSVKDSQNRIEANSNAKRK